MKKISFILVVLAMVAVLFGCGPASQLPGSTFTNEDSYSEAGTTINQSVTIEFAKDGTGTITSIVTETEAETYTYSIPFSWVADGNNVTISGNKLSVKCVYADGDTDVSEFLFDVVLTATLAKKQISVTFNGDDDDQKMSCLLMLFRATYEKWSWPNYEAHGDNRAAWAPCIITLTKN